MTAPTGPTGPTGGITREQLAERATLGALLAQPRQLYEVAGWLRPSDFAHWWHTDIYRAILHEPRLAGRGDPVATAEHVRRTLVESLGPAHADPPALHTLMHRAPDHPVAARYAAMVVEASVRRQVTALATHLEAAPLNDCSNPEHARANPGHTGLDDLLWLVDRRLADLGAHWADAVTATTPQPSHQGAGPEETEGLMVGTTAEVGAPVAVLRPVDVAEDDRTRRRNTNLDVAAERLLRHLPPRRPEFVARHQAQLVAALVTRPDRLTTVQAWLEPEDLTPPTRAVYEALLALRSQRQEIDPVTVAWELGRAAECCGPGPSVDDLLGQVDAGPLRDIDLSATVAAETLNTTARTAAGSLRAAAANPGLSPADLLDTAHWAREAVARKDRDIRGALAPAAPPSLPAAAPPSAAKTSPRRRASWRPARHLAPVRDGREPADHTMGVNR